MPDLASIGSGGDGSHDCVLPGPQPPHWRQRAVAAWRAVTFAFLVLLTFSYTFVGDSTPWGEYLTIWPAMLWLFPLVPMVAGLAMGTKDRRWLLGGIAGTLLFLLAHQEFRTVLRRGGLDQPKPAGVLRVVSWNVGGSNRGYDAIVSELAQFDPDLILLQESPDVAAGTAPPEAWHVEYAGDCAILSREPITVLPTTTVGPWSAPQMALARTGFGSILVCNVRLMLPSLVLNPIPATERARLRADHASRTGQFPRLSQLIAEARAVRRETPVILAGDFNTTAHAKSLAPLRAGLRDIWPECGRGWGATMSSDIALARIDMCWTSSHLEAVRAVTRASALSDHRALIVDLRLREA